MCREAHKALERLFLLFVFAGWLVLIHARLVSTGLVNLANIQLVRQSISSGIDRELGTEQIVNMVTQALAWDGMNEQALYTLGRAYSREGLFIKAVLPLAEVARLNSEKRLVHLELGDVYDALGMSKQALDSYAAIGFSLRENEAVANYLQVADNAMRARDWQTARANLVNAISLDPQNLYANYQIWRLAKMNQTNDSLLVQRAQERLRFYTLAGILPEEARIRHRAITTMPNLVRDGIWELTDILNVAALYLWRGDADGATSILRGLGDSYQNDPRLHYYLAEAAFRQNDLQTARNEIEQVLALQPENAAAYWLLGQIAEHELNSEGAKASYERCLDTMSAHWLCAVSLARISNKTSALQSLSTKAKTAELLRVSTEEVELGSNLLPEVLSAGEATNNWEWALLAAERAPHYQARYQSAFFFADSHQLDNVINPVPTLRIQGFWTRQDPERRRASGNLRYRVGVKPGGLYVLSFVYRTENLAGETTLFFSYDQPQFFRDNLRLPDTKGDWYRFMMVGRNCEWCDDAVTLTLRLWGVGIVDYAQLELRELTLDVPAPSDLPIIAVPQVASQIHGY